MEGKQIKVLVVDDSAVVRAHLSQILDADPRLRVIGAVNNGIVALDYIKDHTPPFKFYFHPEKNKTPFWEHRLI